MRIDVLCFYNYDVKVGLVMSVVATYRLDSLGTDLGWGISISL